MEGFAGGVAESQDEGLLGFLELGGLVWAEAAAYVAKGFFVWDGVVFGDVFF